MLEVDDYLEKKFMPRDPGIFFDLTLAEINQILPTKVQLADFGRGKETFIVVYDQVSKKKLTFRTREDFLMVVSRISDLRASRSQEDEIAEKRKEYQRVVEQIYAAEKKEHEKLKGPTASMMFGADYPIKMTGFKITKDVLACVLKFVKKFVEENGNLRAYLKDEDMVIIVDEDQTETKNSLPIFEVYKKIGAKGIEQGIMRALKEAGLV